MFGHMPELFIVLVIALVVFGPEKLPEVAASAGKIVREVRDVVNDAMHPEEAEVPDDFSAYYYETMAESGEDIPEPEDLNDQDRGLVVPEQEQKSGEQPGEAPDEKLSATAEVHEDGARSVNSGEGPHP